MERLKLSFPHNEKLQRHVRFLYANGSMYLVYNGNLLYHGCIPMNDDGTFQHFQARKAECTAKDFMDRIDRIVRQAYFGNDPEQRQDGQECHVVFVERLPVAAVRQGTKWRHSSVTSSTTSRPTPKNETPITASGIKRKLPAFWRSSAWIPRPATSLTAMCRSRCSTGESPIKAGGKLLVIDGGFSRAYQTETGIAGYTLIFNSYGLLLASHEPFESALALIESETDMISQTQVLEGNNAPYPGARHRPRPRRSRARSTTYAGCWTPIAKAWSSSGNGNANRYHPHRPDQSRQEHTGSLAGAAPRPAALFARR